MLYARALAGLAGAFLLAGCSYVGSTAGDVASTVGLSPSAKPAALVVGDEPYAVNAAAAVLASGGSAADAAAAMYFALSVTYPVAAGLGGGGICLVHDPVNNETVEYDFLPANAQSGGAYAVAGNVRGFAMLQAQYGTLPWQRVVSPAETYASAGFAISKALSARLDAAGDVIRLDAGLSAQFLDESGKVKAVGTVVTNPELAETLAAIRTGGADGFYAGPVAKKLAAYATAESGAISASELNAYKAQVLHPQATKIDSHYVWVPAQSAGNGMFAGVLLNNLARAQRTDVGAKDLEASVVYSVQQSLKELKITDLPKDLGATGFAAMDTKGQAVACAVTMNGPFGSGHTARGTGVTLAKAPSAGGAGQASAFLSPVIVAARSDGPAVLAGAGAGGPNGSAAIAHALARIAAGQDITTRKELKSTGVAPFDTVNAIICTSGVCVALSDPAANGLGAEVSAKE